MRDLSHLDDNGIINAYRSAIANNDPVLSGDIDAEIFDRTVLGTTNIRLTALDYNGRIYRQYCLEPKLLCPTEMDDVVVP